MSSEEPKIGMREVLAIYEQSIMDGQVFPFELEFIAEHDYEVRRLICHKASKKADADHDSEKPTETHEKKKKSLQERKQILIENVNPIDERDLIKQPSIALLTRFNGYVIDHRR
jgi:hypothetical protein